MNTLVCLGRVGIMGKGRLVLIGLQYDLEKLLEWGEVFLLHRSLDNRFDPVIARDKRRVNRAHGGPARHAVLRLLTEALPPSRHPAVIRCWIGKQPPDDFIARRIRRGIAHQKLNAMPGVSCVNSKGAFYLFPNIAGTGLKSTEFCARLLEQQKVAAVPGIAFGADDYIRISYATSQANIEKGLDRMDKFVRSLKA